MTSRRHLLLATGALAVAPVFVRHARAAEVDRFPLGIASGHPTAQSLVLWTRLIGDDLPARVEVQWELAHDEAFSRIAARGTEQALAEDAHSVHAEPASLEPARWYWYRFRALGQQSAVGRTRTAPAADAPASLRFAIASCQRWDHGHYAAWRDAAAQNLDLVMFLGDYIYESAAQPGRVRLHEGGLVKTLSAYRARYAQYKRDPLLQAAHATCPWLTVWDDHEVDNDYAGLQGQHLQAGFAEQRAAAYQAYWEHMPFPKAMRPRGPDMRITGRLDWGRLARIHLLDDRQYRNPQACAKPGQGGSNTVRTADCAALADPKRTLLGWEQERWLADGWDLQRPWNLVAQQTLMAPFTWRDAEGHGSTWTDGWQGYAPARERLLSTVADKRVPGVVVLGGDVHTHYVARLRAEGRADGRTDARADGRAERAPVVASEFCGSSISSSGLSQSRIDAALPHNPDLLLGRAERGTMRFQLDARRLQAEVVAVDQIDDPASPVRVIARFAVDAARPGPEKA